MPNVSHEPVPPAPPSGRDTDRDDSEVGEMSRDVPYEADAICDRCGAKGATDYMGDYFCHKCVGPDKDGVVEFKKNDELRG